MRYRQLGNSDLHVSEIALGSWLTYGCSMDREQTRTCVKQAFASGINFFDTANMYGRGAAESLLGELLADYPRDEFILATKVYYPMSETDFGLSRVQIRKQIDASLKRLRTDYVDLFQCHRYDHDTPLEETMDAMTEVVASGKARYIGFSEWSRRRIEAASHLKHVTPFVSSQPQYSMLYRKAERKVFPICQSLGITHIVWSPLAQGVLTGKYRPCTPPPTDSRAAQRRIRRYAEDSVLQAVQHLRPLARQLGLSLSQLALAWVLRDQRVSAAITGATRPEQIQQNVGAVGVSLDSETLRAIDGVLEGVVRR